MSLVTVARDLNLAQEKSRFTWYLSTRLRRSMKAMAPAQLLGEKQQMQQQIQQLMHQQKGAPPNVRNERQSQQLILKGFDNIDIFF